MASVFADLSIIYCLTILVSRFAWLFFPLKPGPIFIMVFFVYYLAAYWLLKGRTPGKVLCGLRLIGVRGAGLTIGQLMIRELICKTLIGIVIPLFLVMAIFEFRQESWIPLFEVIRKGFAILVVMAISLAALVITRRAWWDVAAKTNLVRQPALKRGYVRGTLIASTFLVLTSACIVFYPFLKEIRKIGNAYYPKYPTSREVKKYADFVRTNGQDPVNYIFSLFDRYDIVVISERMHPEYTQYQLITRIIHDPRFVGRVGNLFTECGSVSFQDTLNTLLRTSFTSADSLDRQTALLQRNSNSIWPLWDNTNLFDLFESVNRLNSGLPDSGKVNWYFTDLPVDWRRKDHRQFVAGYRDMSRDSFMGRQVINRYTEDIRFQKRHRALVIMNSRHAYGLGGISIPGSFRKEYGGGAAAYLVRRFPGKVATVMVNMASLRYGYAMTPIQQGKWDAAFSLLGNPDAAFDFAGSPFGNDIFDAASMYCPSMAYKDVFTGFIFFKPLEEHVNRAGFPYEFEGFEDSVLRRSSVVDKSLVETWKIRIARYKEDKNTLVTTDPEGYAFTTNLLQLTPMIVLVILGLISNLLLLIFGNKSPGA
jgi:uncharacterized RDD family membrane protein YckC